MILILSAFLYAQNYLTAVVVDGTIKNERQIFTQCATLGSGMYQLEFRITALGVAQLTAGESCFSVLLVVG